MLYVAMLVVSVALLAYALYGWVRPMLARKKEEKLERLAAAMLASLRSGDRVGTAS